MTLIPTFTPYTLGWKITNAEYTGNSKSISNVRGIDFKPDGSLFVAVNEVGALQIYDCSTAFDISTATAGSTISITYNSSMDLFRGVQFSDDGNKIFVLGQPDGGGGGSDYLEEHSLSTPYGGTATYVTRTTGPLGSGIFDNFAFTPDGTRLIGTRTGGFYDATLSTGFDLSTISAWSSVYFTVASRGVTWGGRLNEQIVFYDPSGNRTYVGTMSTPEDLSTISLLSSSFILTEGGGATWNVAYANSGKKFYAVDPDTVYEYNTSG